MRANKLEMARAFGAIHAVNAAEEDPVARIQAITGGPGAHSFRGDRAERPAVPPEHRTHAQARRHGVRRPSPHGTSFEFDTRMLMPEKTVIGSMYRSARPPVDVPRLIALYRAGKLKLDELVTRSYPLEDVNEAFAALADGQVARSVLALA